MIFLQNIQGTQGAVPAIEKNVDTIYIRSNIRKITNDDGQDYWLYDEKQLSFQEYEDTLTILNALL